MGNPNLPALLNQGLMISLLGMGLVFAGLLLLWGVLQLLCMLARPRAESPAGDAPLDAGETAEADALTADRARVAAIVAGAFLSNALPMLFEPPAGPAFEHGRTAPSWVTANRARSLHSWQPPRAVESVDNQSSLM